MIFDWIGQLIILFIKYMIFVVKTVLNIITFPLNVYIELFPAQTMLGELLFYSFAILYIIIFLPLSLEFLMDRFLDVQVFFIKLFKKKK